MQLYISEYHTKEYIHHVKNDCYEFDVNHSMSLPLYQKKYVPVPMNISMISFDYICPSTLWQLEFYVGKNRVSYRNICESNEWQTLSIDISEYKEAIRHAFSRPNMYALGINIMSIPVSQAVPFKIKNIHLRPYTDEEKQKASYRQEYQARKIQPHIELNKYLYHTDFLCNINLVKVTDDKIHISGNVCDSDTDFYLYEIPVFAEFSTMEFEKIGKIEKNNDCSFCMETPRMANYGDETYNRLYSRWIICVKSSSGIAIASFARYADEITSLYSIPFIVPKNKKGLGGFKVNDFESDLDELGISFITVNIRINNFLRLKQDEHTLPFEYNGKTYYADNRKIAKYDAAMLAAAKRNIIVYAIILIYPENRSRDKAVGKLLEHPEYDSEGAYTMPDMTTVESVNAYAAAIDFVASRYSRSDNRYGHIHNWIVHNEIDAGKIWANAGKKTALEYMDIYVKSVRMVYYTARKYNGNAEVMVSLTHNWLLSFDTNSYPASLMLGLLLRYSAVEGDFHWGVAYHPYPEELWEPKSWLDKNATPDMQTKLITFKNIEVLDTWIKRPETFYNKTEQRTLILSEQNPNSFDYSSDSLTEQAASLAYVWKKVSACSSISAYIAHSWIDALYEGGLKTGLRKYPEDKDDPFGKKPAWFVYRDIATDKENEACEFAKKIIGIRDWSEIIAFPNIKKKK